MKKVLLVLIMFLSVCYSQAQTKNIGGYMPVAPNVESYLLPEVFTSDNSTDISIYPNPAKNDIFVTSGEKINQIELYNIKGEKMKTFYVDLFETNIDISSLEQGTYMLKVYTDKVVETKKIVKE